MSPEKQEQFDERQFAEVLADLDELAGAIDRGKYRGRAWTPRLRPRRRRIRHIAAGLAAAAAMLIAVGLWWQFGREGEPVIATPDEPSFAEVVERFERDFPDPEEVRYVLIELYAPQDAPANGETPETPAPEPDSTNGNGNGNGNGNHEM